MKDPKIIELKTELRKLEKQAKQLIYKMNRINHSWEKLSQEIIESGGEKPKGLGDILHGWQSK